MNLAFLNAYKDGSEWSLMIAKASGSVYSHVELWLDGPQNAARCFSSREPVGASFMTRDLTGTQWEIVNYVPANDHESDIMIMSFCEGADGKAYDMIGLLGYKVSDPKLHNNHQVFCSEVVSACLRDCAGLVLGKDAWMVSPGDLYALVTK